ncbi:MAG: hypothetical protein OWR52_06160 [Acidibacillus sp.]|nr:hypothetical protein [Acidibacillus sp.]
MERVTLYEASTIAITAANDFFSKELQNSKEWTVSTPSTSLQSNGELLQYKCRVDFVNGKFTVPFSVYIDATSGMVDGVERLNTISPKVGFMFIKIAGIILSLISILATIVSIIIIFLGYSSNNNGPILAYYPLSDILILFVFLIMGLIFSYISYEKPKITGFLFVIAGFFVSSLARNEIFLYGLPVMITGPFYIFGGIFNLFSKQRARFERNTRKSSVYE